MLRTPPTSAFWTLGWQAPAGGELVKLPETYADGVHYTSARRGNIRQELFTDRAAIDAMKNGRPFPRGTKITMEDDRDARLFRYVVMEKPGPGRRPSVREAQRRMAIPGLQHRQVGELQR
jgi:hypothetical protein